MKIKAIILLIALFVTGLYGNAFSQSFDEALRLYEQGMEAYQYGRYEEALNYYERSLKINRSLNRAQGISDNLNNIGVVYSSLGKYDEALRYHKEALKIEREHNLETSATIKLLESLWKYPFQQGIEAVQHDKYHEALGYFEQSLKSTRSLSNVQGISLNLNNIGLVYNILGQYDKALTYFEESLKIKRELNIPQGIVLSLNNIGTVYTNLGQYERALSYFEESLKIKREHNFSLESIATSLNNIGAVYPALGQYDKALTYYEESLKIRRELNIPKDISQSLSNIGAVYDSLGQYNRALSYYEEALKIRRKLKIPKDIALILNDIGLVYDSLGQYEKALTYLEEALKISMELKIPRDIVASLNNIGLVYDSLGQYEKALSYLEKSLKISMELKIPGDIAGILESIGLVYLSQKRYKEAEEKFLVAGSNSGLVEVYLATERNDAALKLLKEMVPKWNVGDPYRVLFHTRYGLALKGNGMFKEASGEFLKAVSLTEEMRQRVKGEKAGFFGGGFYGGRIRAYQGLFSSLSERALKGEEKDEAFSPYGKDLTSSAFYFAESTKARVLLEAMAESAKKGQRIEIPEELREKEQSLINQLSAIDAQWEETYKKGEDVLKRLQERKEGLTAELNNLINDLRKRYPKYAALYYPRPIPPEELPLMNDEVLLEYALGDDAGYIFMVRKGGVKKLLKIALSKEALEEKVKAFIGPMNTKQYSEFSIKEAKELYDILLSPALKDIKEGERIIIIPDGILGLLPFEALVIEEGAGINDSLYVGDRYPIGYYQSATVLALQRTLKGSEAEKVLFALGNPVYSKEDPRYAAWKEKGKEPLIVAGVDKYPFRGLATRREWGKTTEDDTVGNKVEFPPLPETETEVKEIAKMMGVTPKPPDVLLSVRANETELRNVGLERYRYIHFATHADLPGRVQGINEPFILLGQVENKGKDDGFLTLSEVLDLRLNADMVVLSACVTGVGKEVEGEGVANFARSFHHAGARSVVVSLWEVADKPAVEYMRAFYRYLKAGKGRGEALKLSRKEIKAKYPNPFFWAVFILHGEG